MSNWVEKLGRFGSPFASSQIVDAAVAARRWTIVGIAEAVVWRASASCALPFFRVRYTEAGSSVVRESATFLPYFAFVPFGHNRVNALHVHIDLASGLMRLGSGPLVADHSLVHEWVLLAVARALCPSCKFGADLKPLSLCSDHNIRAGPGVAEVQTPGGRSSSFLNASFRMLEFEGGKQHVQPVFKRERSRSHGGGVYYTYCTGDFWNERLQEFVHRVFAKLRDVRDITVEELRAAGISQAKIDVMRTNPTMAAIAKCGAVENAATRAAGGRGSVKKLASSDRKSAHSTMSLLGVLGSPYASEQVLSSTVSARQWDISSVVEAAVWRTANSALPWFRVRYTERGDISSSSSAAVKETPIFLPYFTFVPFVHNRNNRLATCPSSLVCDHSAVHEWVILAAARAFCKVCKFDSDGAPLALCADHNVRGSSGVVDVKSLSGLGAPFTDMSFTLTKLVDGKQRVQPVFRSYSAEAMATRYYSCAGNFWNERMQEFFFRVFAQLTVVRDITPAELLAAGISQAKIDVMSSTPTLEALVALHRSSPGWKPPKSLKRARKASSSSSSSSSSALRAGSSSDDGAEEGSPAEDAQQQHYEQQRQLLQSCLDAEATTITSVVSSHVTELAQRATTMAQSLVTDGYAVSLLDQKLALFSAQMQLQRMRLTTASLQATLPPPLPPQQYAYAFPAYAGAASVAAAAVPWQNPVPPPPTAMPQFLHLQFQPPPPVFQQQQWPYQQQYQWQPPAASQWPAAFPWPAQRPFGGAAAATSPPPAFANAPWWQQGPTA